MKDERLYLHHMLKRSAGRGTYGISVSTAAGQPRFVANPTWHMGFVYTIPGFNPKNKNLQIDIDPHNSMGGSLAFAQHAMDVVWNTVSGTDTNYHTAASRLGLSAAPCQ